MSERTEAERIAVAAGGGMADAEIAAAFGLTLPELRAKYGRELRMGAHQKRLELIEALYDLALAGNVAAARTYTQTVAKKPGPAPLPKAAKVPRVRKPEPPGKKVIVNAEARVAQRGTAWEAVLAAPAT